MKKLEDKSFMFRSKKNTKSPFPVKNENSEVLEVDKWIISDFVISKLVPVVGYHPYPVDELLFMVSATCLARPSHIVEWGTHIGKSARIFYETCKNFNIQSRILSFDLPDEIEHVEHPKAKRGYMVKGLDGVELFQADALDLGLKILNEIDKDNRRVLFYIDGDHDYASVLKELQTVSSQVPDGSILLHDTFYQSDDSNYNVGPYRAVQDFLISVDLKYYVYATQFGLPGMTLLIPKK